MTASILRRCFFVLAFLAMIQVCLGSWSAAKKVQLDLYYESLCPFCANFIVNILPIIFENGIIDIVEFVYYFLGETPGSFRITPLFCQHGPTECLFNSVEACAIDAWPNLDDHLPFVTCLESQLYEDKYDQWEICFKKFVLDPKPVTSCYDAAYGKRLQLKYVPWLVVAGEPLLEDYANFVSYICKAYKGTPPSACKKASFASGLREKTNHVYPVSYSEQTAKTQFDVYFPFIPCIESLIYERKYFLWETCFKKLNLDPRPVTDCYKGDDGKKLDLKYAALTAALEPPHEYVPWVVVDGQPLLEDCENFISYICKDYKGS